MKNLIMMVWGLGFDTLEMWSSLKFWTWKDIESCEQRLLGQSSKILEDSNAESIVDSGSLAPEILEGIRALL